MFKSDKHTINLAVEIQIFIDSLEAQKPNSLIK